MNWIILAFSQNLKLDLSCYSFTRRKLNFAKDIRITLKIT